MMPSTCREDSSPNAVLVGDVKTIRVASNPTAIPRLSSMRKCVRRRRMANSTKIMRQYNPKHACKKLGKDMLEGLLPDREKAER
jgi:hypothetical protein